VRERGEPIDVLRRVELPEPEPGPGQLRIRVTAAGIGLPDVFMCRHTYPLTPPTPFTPGQEATGIVTGALLLLSVFGRNAAALSGRFQKWLPGRPGHESGHPGADAPHIPPTASTPP